MAEPPLRSARSVPSALAGARPRRKQEACREAKSWDGPSSRASEIPSVSDFGREALLDFSLASVVCALETANTLSN